MKEQTSIPKHKIARAATIVGTGAKIGVNYLARKSREALGQDAETAKAAFHDQTAADTYEVFSKLKGGPLKVAQMLSLDQNLMPQQYVDEFSKAQYSAPPLSYPLVVRTFKREFGKGPRDLFDTFGQSAAAGASIGQVHKATKDNKTYAVKVQYPGVRESLRSDLQMVKPFALRLFNLDSETLDPYIAEVEARVSEETDYKLEVQRSIDLAQKSNHIPLVHFPTYYPELSSTKVITMDWVDGLHLDQFAASNPSQAERDAIGQALWDFYDHQIHTLKCFHADPHAGNFIVRDRQLWILDFGCVKELDEDFYREYFTIMDAGRTARDEDFVQLLRSLKILRKDDTQKDVNKLLPLIRESVELLSRPFQTDTFDFGDEAYLLEIASFGEKARTDPELQKMQGGRGNAEALYINRSYFGLYNLLGQLKAKVHIKLPPFIRERNKSAA
ncbi:MAG: AarF/ABC1/UbiB kinase family protein [Verrucomicrobiota bacterium]